MIFPKVYRTIRTPSVISIVGDRVGRNGEIAQDELRPYITWSIVIGDPHVHLSGSPTSDFTTVDINCWHGEDSGIETLTNLVVAALDDAYICNRITINDRDPATRMYHVGIEADFITQRAS